MPATPTRVVVIGAGYAGVIAANRLRRDTSLQIALINPRAEFVERIRLHQYAAGTGVAVHPLTDLLGAGIRSVVDTAERIETDQRRVLLASGDTLPYDHLIYAVGSSSVPPQSVPGAAQHAFGVGELEQAQRLRSRLAQAPDTAPIVVVGAGLTGIETACELAVTGRRVTLVGDALGPTLGAAGRRSVRRALERLGVRVLAGRRVEDVRPAGVRLDDDTVLPSEITVWTAGFGVSGLAAGSGLSTDGAGRLLTDETLTSVDDPRIVAAGDVAAPSGRPLRMSCQSAMPLGAQAAQTVLARIAGTQPEPIRQAFAAQCLSLGRRLGTVQFCHPDDSPRRLALGGAPAAFVKEQICRATVSGLRGEARRPGSFRWLRSGWRTDLVAHQAASGASDGSARTTAPERVERP